MSVGDTDFSPAVTAIKLVLTIHPFNYRGWGILAYCVEIFIQICYSTCIQEATAHKVG